MKAAVYKGPGRVLLEIVQPPVLLNPTDAIIDVMLTAICGTDLHPYRGHIHDFKKDCILGHEFTGIVKAVGSEVKNIKVGDRVVASDVIACGSCWYCKKGLHYQCEKASLFGYGEVVGEYTPGGQAEMVRVPFAETVLHKIPDQISDEEALLVSDILSTGFTCTEEADIQHNDIVAVVGGGPLGLMISMCAQLYHPKMIIVIEPNDTRRKKAEELGAIALSPGQLDKFKKITEKRGADIVFEAVGVDKTLKMSLDLVRSGGKIVCAGSHKSENFPLNTRISFAKEISIKFAVGNPIKYSRKLLQLIGEKKLHPTKIITHRLSFDEVEEAYRIFNEQEALKVILQVKREKHE
ncbi:alcohol dehydrogenase catalytic domain-containing protein [Cytobacillus oceanisediminis]|uniref:alcohol dehydrogenase catalytic domain-containing protein n=1 Tax=Cytobacillus oceanisediminis TaxID=665099 RepID=UPI001C23DE8E|nr:alcohol dehydrogenase catalytic domain-containing protein [Cytobacillus oceanisediminis]MBU8772079.1 alcohol dehydrogenase catalytic domain-containing protein [Cytobacillus oceanisediminis]